MEIDQILKNYNKEKNTLDYDSLYIKYLGKKGIINEQFDKIKGASKQQKIKYSKKLNSIKNTIIEDITKVKSHKRNKVDTKIDLSIPVDVSNSGNIHPISQTARDMNNFFHYYGFSVGDGPEIEDDWHNFEMMGVPKDHPARELQDTLYIMEPEVLLRTQVSSVEARYLEEYKPPIRVVLPGKVYRNETKNKSNGAIFHHYQGFYVDKDVNLGHLKWMFEKILKHLLGDDTKIRYRSKYYPEVEPGLSPDFQCKFCKGEGCDVCKYRGWIEAAGGGIIHQKTLEKAGIDYKQYSGFAFGFGLDRLAMTKYKIDDLRLLFGNYLYK